MIYNGLIYPAIFFTALIISAFNKKLRQSIKGKLSAIGELKNYLNKIDSISNL